MYRYAFSLRWSGFLGLEYKCIRPTTPRFAMVGINGHPMRVLASGEPSMLCRPCVDCGLRTGCFCDHCLAEARCPDEKWAPGQMTPLCSKCDTRYDSCHYCRGVIWCTPREK